jgi:FAD/FMN-containing dehydrogenase
MTTSTDSTTQTPTQVPAELLRTSMQGPVFTAAHPDFDDVRAVWNASIDRSPAVIARPTGVADVIAAVRFATEHDLPIAIRGGGHSFAGLGTCDDGLLIDLVLMKGIRVDPEARVAVAQGGVTWGDLDHETAVFGLATTGGLVSTTGVTGLTLGGGIGWLMRKHGLACDNVIGADLVTAAGEFLHVSADSHPDLFWALRGGGGNFGVVTSLEYRLHPVETVLGGMLLYPAEAAADVLAFYEERNADEPDELCTLLEFATAPDIEEVAPEHRGRPVLALAFCYCGPVGDGEVAIAPWRTIAPVVGDFVEPVRYVELQKLWDDDYPPGLWSYMKSHYVDDLSPSVVSALVAAGANRPTHRAFVDVHHLEGAPARVAADATAFDQRDARYVIMFGGVCDTETDLDACRTWAREHWSALATHGTGHTYVNFMSDADTSAVRAAWGAEKYERLVAVKDRYDPTNRFRFNHNIEPTKRTP